MEKDEEYFRLSKIEVDTCKEYLHRLGEARDFETKMLNSINTLKTLEEAERLTTEEQDLHDKWVAALQHFIKYCEQKGCKSR